MKKLFVVVFAFCFSIFANAYEVKRVCAKYSANYGWSQGYDVEAIIADGGELGEKLNCITCFNSLTKYIVIFWNNGGYTIIDLNTSLVGLLNDGVDQNGRKWQVSTGGICM